MRGYTAQLKKDAIWVGNVLMKYKIPLLMVEVFLHCLLAIVAKHHQFDVAKASIQLSLGRPQGGRRSQLSQEKLMQLFLPYPCVLRFDAEMGYRLLNNVEEKLLILQNQPTVYLVSEVVQNQHELKVRLLADCLRM